MNMNLTYLGDSVYIESDLDGGIILTVRNGVEDKVEEIYLDWSVLENLKVWVRHLEDRREARVK